MGVPLVFKVHRHEPELLAPAKPTPHEFKLLSDIDDQDGLRVQLPLIFFYRYHPSMRRNDPIWVLKQALAKTLVFYYPFAGRLREWPNRKLVVECTGEGILFLAAEADVSLDQFGEIRHPFPCLDELIFDVPDSSGIVNCPLMLLQATRLKCGGIIIGLRYNHTIADAGGVSQFWSIVGEMTLGAHAPAVLPVWERHLLSARDPPRVTCVHDEYVELVDTEEKVPMSEKDHRSFFFGHNEMSLLRRFAPPQLGRCSRYELLTACLWKCRTIALQLMPDEEIRALCIVNARNRFNPPIPKGYYGNCIAYSAAKARAGDLSQKPIGYAIELIRKAKDNVTEEYMRSVADLMVIKGRPWYTMVRSFLVSAAQFRFDEVDLGWGKAVFAGPAKGNVASFQIPYRTKNGEDGILVTLCLPRQAMQRFMNELYSMLKKDHALSSAL